MTLRLRDGGEEGRRHRAEGCVTYNRSNTKPGACLMSNQKNIYSLSLSLSLSLYSLSLGSTDRQTDSQSDSKIANDDYSATN